MLLWSFTGREMRIVGLVGVQGPPICFCATLWRVQQYHVFQFLADGIMFPVASSWRWLEIVWSACRTHRWCGIMLMSVPCCQLLGDQMLFPNPRSWLLFMPCCQPLGDDIILEHQCWSQCTNQRRNPRDRVFSDHVPFPCRVAAGDSPIEI